VIGALTGHASRPGAAAGGEVSELDAEARSLAAICALAAASASDWAT
jgi:hypothetical protein